MKKLVNCLYLSFAVAVFGISALKPALAQDLITNNYNNNILIKKVAIYRTLAKYNSPLVNEVDAFLNACMSYGINCYLLPSISGVESTFGRFLMPDSHNPFGWGGGYLYFPSWQVSFLTVAKGLRENYIDNGLTSVEMIGPVYAPPSSTWSGKVLMFMRVFAQEEAKIPTTLFEI
ncbi:hypothetical protein A2313_03810 [Candidatus Roizmanbacteria bacterium RIFOXYB2_FULL_41_10]|nr:MAG: hypothetical protein A2262_04610 [Candidatus Roizmanbacteria bacterium RIFOXYA2_FULL_41_8]OGK69236.1 MAG: hypothetical protein A2313_03810 [Candidatus Roizmanbacteria bacterium RIFOXYB2_FULL_41_10]OGK72979.1 MAG: hypothetical protein A2459_00805 [Candidatus Roizmanbacteria bacterium RIFOXYC2_FULL_41_10]OGZ28249.1 MAG: hypothetical protein A2562_00230 [Candidatus Nealsonbacteria bacterium RIFOXYD1_FULL_39_11]